MKLSNAIIISLVAHIVMIALLAFNYQFSKVDVKQNKAPRQMNATAVNAENVRKHLKSLKQKDIDKKNKEIERLRKIKKQEDDSRKKRIEEEDKIKKAKQRRKEEERKRKQKKADDAKKKKTADDKARKKKIALDKKKKADAEKKRKVEADRKRKQKEDAEKKRKEAARKKKLAEEKAAQDALEKEMEQQMADEAAALSEVQQQYVMTEADKFKLLIENKIHRNFIEPEQEGHCDFRIKIAPGGLIIGIQTVGGDSLYCETGRRAINKAEPLPISKDPEVYEVLKELFFRLKNKDKE